MGRIIDRISESYYRAFATDCLRMSKYLTVLLMSFFGLSVPIHAAFVPTDDGVYAQFIVTHDGTEYEFTAELHYKEVPMTVLNFMELAEGTKSWADFASVSQKNTPFYNGLTFHRVVSGFVMQAGSRNGSGSDGPGFQFPDEIDGSLSHHTEGVLSMANSGPNSNGSQFFITLAAATFLDGKHSIFGVIVDGMADVTALGIVPADGNGKPLSEMTITSASIIRVGLEANDFSAIEQVRPQVASFAPLEFIADVGPLYTLRIPNRDSSLSYQLYGSIDLKNTWANLLSISQDFSLSGDFDVAATSLVTSHEKYFFTVAESFVGSRVDGTGLGYTFSLGRNPDIVLNLTSSNGGAFSFAESSGDLVFYELYDLGERYQLYFQMSGFVAFQCYFDKNASSGSVFSHVKTSPESNIIGTFTSP